MGLMASLLFFGYILVLGFAASKIRAESGCRTPISYPTSACSSWPPWVDLPCRATGMLVATMPAAS